MQFSNRPSAERQLTRNALIINVLMMVIALPTSALFGYLAYTENIPQLYILAFFVLATFIFEFTDPAAISQHHHPLIQQNEFRRSSLDEG